MTSLPDESDNISWKKRYLQLEQQTETLGKALQRLCAAAKGLDQELDQQLEPLQTALKQQPGDAGVSRYAGALERGIMQHFRRRDEGVRLSLEAFRQQLTQLGDLSADTAVNGRIDALLATLPEAVEHYYRYPELLQSLAQLQQQALAALDHAGSEPEGAGAEEDLELACLRIGGLLLDLLSQLSVPLEHLPGARALIQRIEAGFEWQELEVVIESAVALTLKCAINGQEEFENYLSGLNAQLLDIRSFLGESRDHQRLSRTSAEALDTRVRRDVAQVEGSLSSAQSLDQLKSAVRVQLAEIVLAMDHYRHEQAEREQQTQARLASLQEKLVSMESQAARAQSHLEEQRLRALSDPLTGLPNRAAYDERLKLEFARWARYAGELTLVVCDLDHFKQINDNYGHLAGDKVLRLMGRMLPAGLRETDFVARYGGEEFVMLLPETDAKHTRAVMEKLRETVSTSPFNFKGEPVKVTMSFGIAEFGPSETPEQVFHRADAALYQAKQQGRNRCVIAPGV